MQRNRLAWTVVALLFAGSVINYLDRALLGFVMPQIRQSLSLSNADYGLVVNSFLVMYMIFYILGGRIADRIGYRRAFSINVVIWSIAAMLHSIVQGIAGLCVFRALLGVGEGGFYPTAMRGISRWFPPENRAKAVSIVLTGVGVGMLITPPVMAWITFHYGWRPAFLVTGAVGLLLVPPWLLFHRRVDRILSQRNSPTADQYQEAVDSAPEGEMSVGEVLRRRQYWFLLAARAVTDAIWFFYLFWLPGYLQEIRGFDLRAVGTLLWIPYLCADVGSLGGAWISSGLIKRGYGLDRGRKIVLVASVLLCLCGPVAYCVWLPSVTLALISIAFFGQFSWGATLQCVITEITPPRHIALLYGITGAAGTMMGAISQLFIGRVVDSFGYEPVFLGAGFTFLVAMTMLLTSGKIEVMRPRLKVLDELSVVQP